MLNEVAIKGQKFMLIFILLFGIGCSMYTKDQVWKATYLYQMSETEFEDRGENRDSIYLAIFVGKKYTSPTNPHFLPVLGVTADNFKFDSPFVSIDFRKVMIESETEIDFHILLLDTAFAPKNKLESMHFCQIVNQSRILFREYGIWKNVPKDSAFVTEIFGSR